MEKNINIDKQTIKSLIEKYTAQNEALKELLNKLEREKSFQISEEKEEQQINNNNNNNNEE